MIQLYENSTIRIKCGTLKACNLAKVTNGWDFKGRHSIIPIMYFADLIKVNFNSSMSADEVKLGFIQNDSYLIQSCALTWKLLPPKCF